MSSTSSSSLPTSNDSPLVSGSSSSLASDVSASSIASATASAPAAATAGAGGAAAAAPVVAATSSAEAPAAPKGKEPAHVASAAHEHAPEDSPNVLPPAEKKTRWGCCGRSVRGFKQQQLWYCQPVLRPFVVALVFTCLGFFFLAFGAALVAASESVVEVSVRYDKKCGLTPAELEKRNTSSYPISDLDGLVTTALNFTDGKNPNCTGACTANGLCIANGTCNTFINSTLATSCSVDVKIPRTMKPPIYVYYELTGVYQTHRRYIASQDSVQLTGVNSRAGDVTDCSPIVKYNGSAHGKQAVWMPCGLVAWSVFNDTYSFVLNGSTTSTVNSTTIGNLTVTDHHIAWPSDKGSRFGNPHKLINRPLLNIAIYEKFMEDEKFINWMRPAALPHFRKLAGKIKNKLHKHEIVQINIENRWPVKQFDGSKKIVLSTMSWMGGKNLFLGIAYLVLGGLLELSGLALVVLRIVRPRKLGDPRYLHFKTPARH